VRRRLISPVARSVWRMVRMWAWSCRNAARRTAIRRELGSRRARCGLAKWTLDMKLYFTNSQSICQVWFRLSAIQTVAVVSKFGGSPRGVRVARVIRRGHPAERDQQLTCATWSRWRATPGSDDPGHSRTDERTHSVDEGSLLSELQPIVPTPVPGTLGFTTETSEVHGAAKPQSRCLCSR
jgi:hypothetical protein